MQEGAVSLMQMAKVSSALMRLDESNLPYISVLTDPTTGGVTASFAMLGDLNLGEPGALIGFAGPRVIEQSIRQKLPEGFQRSEFLLKHGMLDAVVPRGELKAYIAKALDFFAGPVVWSIAKLHDLRGYGPISLFANPELKTVKWTLTESRFCWQRLETRTSQEPGLSTPFGTNGKQLHHDGFGARRLRAADWSLHFAAPAQSPRTEVTRLTVSSLPKQPGARRSCAAAEVLLAREKIDAHPSFFETVTAMAFVAFRKRVR